MTAPLFVDTFSGAQQPASVWSTYVAAGPPWHGAIIKATQSINFAPSWFLQHWPAIKVAAGARYGQDFFRGAYHYLIFNVDGAKQADFFLDHVDRAGGWDVGDLWPVVDVERGQDKPNNPNYHASAQQIVDCTSAFAARCKQRTGRQLVLYGNGAMHDNGITSHMGCDYIYPASYTATLDRVVTQRIGWSIDKLFAWQYAGDGVGKLAGYPLAAPGLGTACDISVLTLDGGDLGSLRSKLWAENPNAPSGGTLVATGIVGALVGGWAFARGVFDRLFFNTR